ncbi:hypothetical protein GCM10010503_37560 [Streptomyces lucensis JCM 4490]|uniref:Uncharacterized protein n=1 Tax=Streptomyces lucensis JCM 4490 TaxID=1306176 RepID=A0A918MTB5_9ACTN|nr:hypothetical protein GCM10010503_37560 [Streptomyces lucensis JCM 4490]
MSLSVAMRSMGSSVPSSRANAFVDAVRTAAASVGARSGQEADGLGDIAVGGGCGDPEPGRELGVRVNVTEVGEGK